MIIADEWIFVHVPKVAGSSIIRALGGSVSDENMHRPLFMTPINDRPAFGFVRNPWDRMVSLYSRLIEKTHFVDLSGQRITRSFKDWLTEDEYYANHDDNWPGQPPHQRRSQMWWLEGCDFVGRFETLDADFDHVCRAYGINTGGLPHVNRSSHGHYSTYYDDRARDFVAHYFKPEIDLFGYKFEEPND